MHFRRSVGLSAMAASAVLVCFAQQTAEVSQQETPFTFSTGVNLVLAPVVVRDAQGHAIGTLKKEDFQLFDKGKPQDIVKFSIEKAEAPPVLPDTSIQLDANGNPVNKTTPSGQRAPGHFVMWLFDDVHLSFDDLSRLREAAKKTLRESFEPGTRAALYTTSNHTSLDFTDDIDKLNAKIDEIKPWPTTPPDGGSRDCFDVSYYQADRIINANDQDALNAAATDFYNNCPEAMQFVAQAAEAARTGTVLQPNAELLSYVRMLSIKGLEIGNQDTRNTLLILKQLIRRMSAMPGSRTIALVSPGFYLIDLHRQDESDVMNNAVRNNVVISSIDARGVWTTIPGGTAETLPSSSPSAMTVLKQQYEASTQIANQDILQELALATGGTFFHNSNDFTGGLKQIATQPDFIYVLGFAPQNLKFDGSYHALKVQLKGGLKYEIQARRGYYERRHMENAAEETKREIEETFFTRDEMRELPVQMNTQFFKTGEAKARLSVLSRIDAKHLKYRKADGRNDDTLTVVAGVFDRNGNFVVGTQKVVDLKLKDQTLDKLPDSGITVKTNLDVASGEYVVRLVVRDSEGQVMSALNGAVTIP